MKNSILVIFIFISNFFFTSNISGQDYQLFFSNRFYIYEFDLSGISHFAVFKAENKIFVSGDTIFSNYASGNDDFLYGVPANSTVYYSDTTWSGYKCVIKQNGENVLLNRYSDSLFFLPSASVGTSWMFCQFSNGSKYMATVSTVTNDTVFGIIDSVKRISILKYDSIGNPMADSLNNFQFHLSKSYGLLKTVNIKYFPEKLFVYQLKGIDSVAGEQRINPSSLFDYNVGDVFQYQRNDQTSLSNYVSEMEKKYILSKTINPNDVTYTIDDSLYTITTIGTAQISILTHSIITEVDQKDFNSNDSLFSKLPYDKSDFNFDYYETSWHRPINGRRGIYTISCIRRDQPWIPTYLSRGLASCSQPYCVFPGGSNWFVEGLGFFSSLASMDSASSIYTCHKYMIYYKKGNEVYGSPVNFPVTTDVKSNSESLQPVLLFPNPVNEFAVVQNAGKVNSITIYDAQMHLSTFNWSNNSNSILLDCKNLSPGFYIMKMENEFSTRFLKIVVAR